MYVVDTHMRWYIYICMYIYIHNLQQLQTIKIFLLVQLM